MANHTACCSLPIINMYLFPLIITCFCLIFVSATTNITTNLFLRDHETLVSSNSAFKIGFFSTINSSNRYLGIWYNTNDKESNRLEIIWLANRDNPLNDTSGVLKISKNGDLQLVDGQNTSFWSSNTSVADSTTVAAQLLDTGNLVLASGTTGMNIWQSFEHPTDSWLPSMTFIVNLNATGNQMVTSWRSASDPSSGRFRLGIVPRNLPEFFTLDGDKPYWRSGPWNGYLYIGVPFMNSMGSTGVNIIDRHDGTLYVAYSVLNRALLERFILNYDGRLVQKDWNNTSLRWEVVWQSIESECDVYGKCGPFGICDSKTSPICSCLTGFEPKVIDGWSKGDWSRGCVRKTELNCDSTVGKEDDFLGYKHVKVPDYSYRISLPASDPNVCRKNCSQNCSCLAYAYYSGIGCMIWSRSLIDIQQFTADGADLFVRLAHSDIPGQRRKWKIMTAVLVILGSSLFVAILCIISRRLTRQRGEKAVFDAADFKDLHLFTLENLKIATTNFSECNKLGQGGFGPVYKGKLEDGQEIAVKRLLKASGQGAEEFMNEVIVISKLQHKNLVRLLGCCIQGEEKLLVYEYMPKKSLDTLLFDPGHKQQLDWKTRLKIIKGICRGLMYLHRDSRLRIIHRDLKASNILLDEELDPKISDFGMARIFDTKQDQANTLRVVGTYGYMSPEYAMEGRFSEKSDVYSLGVLLLEMVSGRKNKSFLRYEFSSLLAYAWKLLNENDMLSFIDPAICDPCCEYEMLRCIQLGLLCVQELPEDRPSVSTLIYLLDNNATGVPHPKQPGFTQTTKCSANNVSQDDQDCSVNHLTTTTLISGR